jgi:hypothetical protein
VNELVDALRRAVRAEIAAAVAEAGPVSQARHLTSLAERMEVERCWAYAAAVAGGLGPQRERHNGPEHGTSRHSGPP